MLRDGKVLKELQGQPGGRYGCGHPPFRQGPESPTAKAEAGEGRKEGRKERGEVLWVNASVACNHTVYYHISTIFVRAYLRETWK